MGQLSGGGVVGEVGEASARLLVAEGVGEASSDDDGEFVPEGFREAKPGTVSRNERDNSRRIFGTEGGLDSSDEALLSLSFSTGWGEDSHVISPHSSR